MTLPNHSPEPSTLRCGHKQRDGPCGRPLLADGQRDAALDYKKTFTGDNRGTLRCATTDSVAVLADGHHGQRSARLDIWWPPAKTPAWLSFWALGRSRNNHLLPSGM